METEITRLDECEAQVDFSGRILISYETKSDFERELAEVVNKYAI